MPSMVLGTQGLRSGGGKIEAFKDVVTGMSKECLAELWSVSHDGLRFLRAAIYNRTCL
jgi:hypothetical protein